MVNCKLCAFADEADKALAGQIKVMLENGIGYLEMRGVDGVNVAKLTKEAARAARRDLDAAGIKVWSLGSPAGKTPITDPFDFEEEQFKRLLETAEITGARCIRLFSFYGTEGKPEYRDEVLFRLSRFVDLAKGSGVTLCHENEKGIYGDIAVRCAEIHRALAGVPAVFDPANFVQCGQDTLAAWELLEPYVYYGHIKDARADGHVVPPGRGEGNLPTYLKRFFAKGCEVLTLEPHLSHFVGRGALENEPGNEAAAEWKFENSRAAFDFAAGSLKNILKEI